jgi:ATP-binding protein involved in chromosome partitioning
MLFGKKPASEDEIRKVLSGLPHPHGETLGTLGLIEGIVLKDGEATFVLKLMDGDQNIVSQLREATENAVKKLCGIKAARAVFTAAAQPAPAPRKAPSVFNANSVKALGKIIAVLSGKGGVGKSTVAANLAVSLAAQGLRVGLLDADIYGPSVPRLFGLVDQKPNTDNGKLVPLEKHGLKIMSIGFIVDSEMPVVWRGAMVQKAIRQLIEDVAWGTLDALVIDMPPGTGDVQLTLAQSTQLAGAVVVSTPQDLALIDARKAIAMFNRMDVPILGLIENMSGFVCPHCGEESHIFGHGGAEAEAKKISEEFLGAIPLDLRLRETSDAGTPLVAAEPENKITDIFRRIASRVWDKVATKPSQAAQT